MKKKEKQDKKKEKKGKHKILKTFLLIILIILFGIGAFLGYSTYKNGWGTKGLIQTVMGHDEEQLKDLDPFTVLILGVSNDISTELTDTIMIASYNPKTQIATLFSIPRDTFVGTNKEKASSYDKINALYQKGPEKTLDAVNRITGLNIKYYVVVNNNAFIQIVDAIGGVEFDVPIKMDYDDPSQDLHIHLKSGLQKLTGEQAEWVVRFRKNNNGTSYPSEYGDNDIGRMRTQREFIKVVVNQTIQLKNITKIGKFIDIFKENIQTNITNWSLIKDYIPYAVDFNTENIQTASLPGQTGQYGPYNLWFFVHDKKKTTELIDELFTQQNKAEENEESSQNDTNSTTNATSSNKTNTTNTTNTTINTSSNSKTNTTSNTTSSNTEKSTSTTNNKNSNVKIELLNGSGNSSNLTNVTKILKDAGYNVYKTGTTTTTSKTTIVNKTTLQSAVAEDLKDLLGVGNISNSISTSSSVDITIVIGKDYK